jgi:hypothetical protein
MATVSSAPGATDAVIASISGWWIKDPLNSSFNRVIEVDMKDFDITNPQEGASYSPLERQNKVHLTAFFRGGEFPLKILTDDKPEHDILLFAFMTPGKIFRIENWLGMSWYVMISGQMQRKYENYGQWFCTFSINWVEVDAP